MESQKIVITLLKEQPEVVWRSVQGFEDRGKDIEETESWRSLKILQSFEDLEKKIWSSNALKKDCANRL